MYKNPLRGESMSLYVTDSKGYSLPIVINLKDPFSPDSHNMYRIIIIKSGSGIININNTSFIFMAPSIVCLNEKDEILLEKDTSIDADVIYFLPTTIHNEFTLDNLNTDLKKLRKLHNMNIFLLTPFLYRYDFFKGVISMSNISLTRLNNLSNSLKEEINNFKNYWRCRSRSLFLEILFLIQYLGTEYEDVTTIPLSNSSSEMNEILLYLHTNYANKITVDHLSREYGMNRTTLSQKFLSQTGYTIKQYLIQIRIKISSMMLKDTLLPISEVAYRAGFNDSTHFTRTFKKHLDMLPSKYREKMFQQYR